MHPTTLLAFTLTLPLHLTLALPSPQSQSPQQQPDNLPSTLKIIQPSNNGGPGSSTTTTANLAAWPPVPFGIELDRNPPYRMEMTWAGASVPSLSSAAETVLQDVRHRLELLPRHIPGPAIVDLKGPGNAPWIGCKPSREVGGAVIPWDVGTTVDFMRTLQAAIKINGFVEFGFGIYGPGPRRGRFAECMFLKDWPIGGVEGGGFLGGLAGNESAVQEF